MKWILVLLFSVSALAIGCGGGESGNTTGAASDDALSKNPVYQKGLDLVTQNRCFQCHTIEKRVNGPSYREVAAKYAGYPDTIVTHLAQRVIKGGSGVWGQIVMIPHPTVTQPDAEAMVRYVLLLKK